jgi:dienelactone hydrolase
MRGTAVFFFCGAAWAQTLPGTAPLTASGDLAAQMVEGIHRYLDRATAASVDSRPAPDRERLRTIIGAVDRRLPVTALELQATTSASAEIASGTNFKVFAVRWPVVPGVTGEGLLFEPGSAPVARIVAIPDAEWTPDMVAQATRLAENGAQVVVPLLIDRRDTWSGIPGIRMTNLPHREFLYRMSFEVGRHIIGYEVQKILSVVDWFAKEGGAPIRLYGYGEGGLLALYSAALDTRIDRTVVSGYFQSREQVWREPVYRDVWGLLREFGDAGIAALIAPRQLVIEMRDGPEIAGPPPETKERRGAASGRLVPPPMHLVNQEVDRARPYFAKAGAAGNLLLLENREAVRQVLLGERLRPADLLPRIEPWSEAAMRRQFVELVQHTQRLVEESPKRRAEFWATADDSSPERWRQSTAKHRDYIWSEVIGKMPPPSLPANPRARLIYDEPKFRGYEVMLDVWPDVFASGILLVPKDVKPGEKRPVVVCQHGLEGRPSDVADPKVDSPYYHRYAVRLAEEGFVVYAPQNPYIGQDRFRQIQRKGHPLKLSLFAFIIGQHERTTEWLASLPFVDPSRIGFYGLSYGGKTAVRVPQFVDRYALSICSADFNEWVWKNTSIRDRYSYLATPEYDMIEFNFANIVNYAELANLMAPRPFMVERGHADGVAPDEWVAYEFAKVRRFYATKMKLPDRAEIEFFDGPHTINGQGTFAFLRRHLRWP